MSEKNISLYNIFSNEERAIDISADAGCVIPHGYQLLRLDDRHGLRNGYEIALINDLELSLAYYTRVTLQAGTATQKAWRSANAQHAAVISEVADKIFYEYLLRRHDVILSNDQLTGEGHHRWERQLSHALERGLKIYHCKIGGQLQLIENQTALNDLVDSIWSNPGDNSPALARICKGN